MKEICIVNKGENSEKLIYSMSLNIKDKQEDYNKNFNFKYITLEQGSDDITIVRNYNPLHIRKIQENETLLDIYANGFEINNSQDIKEGDIVVLSRPEGLKYSVKPLETITDISKMFSISVEEIISKNNLETEKLFVGQILII